MNKQQIAALHFIALAIERPFIFYRVILPVGSSISFNSEGGTTDGIPFIILKTN